MGRYISFGSEISEFNNNLNLQDVKIDDQEKYIFDLRERIVELNKQNHLLYNISKKPLTQYDKYSTLNISLIREIISSIAHEINQPLTAISSYSIGCSFYIKNKSKYKKDRNKLLNHINKISVLSEYAGKIIDNMMRFIFNEEIFFEKADINTVLKDSLSILKYENMDFNIKFTLCLFDDLPAVKINITHIIQVILNLVRNSINALRIFSHFQPEIIIKTNLSGRCVVVDFIDYGPGFSSDLLKKTTEKSCPSLSKGLGIGLNICRALIEAHGGIFCMNNSMEKGAWFYFTLPVAESS